MNKPRYFTTINEPRYLTTYSVEWVEKHPDYCYRSSMMFFFKYQADDFVKSLKNTYPEEEYPGLLSIDQYETHWTVDWRIQHTGGKNVVARL